MTNSQEIIMKTQNLNKSEEVLSNIEMQSTTHLASSFDDEDEDGGELKPCAGPVGIFYAKLRSTVAGLIRTDAETLSKLKYLTLVTVISAYIVYAFVRWLKSDCDSVGWSDGYGFAFILYALTAAYLMIVTIKPLLQAFSANASVEKLNRIKSFARWIYYSLLAVGVLIFLIVSLKDASDEPRRYVSLVGYFALLLVGFLFSKHPDYVRWDIVCRGVSLHMVTALIIVKWAPGRDVLQVFSQKIIAFMEFAYVGARFVYGDLLIDLGVFLFKSLSVLFFLAMVINVMFYYGILQSMFRNLGTLMQVLVGTTIIESSNSVASVFLGMSEAPLLFKPYLAELTASEVHAVMTSGFATVAGTVLAAYVSFGADPATLVSASAMAAPASLTLAKLFYPETRRTKTSTKNLIIYKSEDANAVDAACKGAMLACEIVPAIAANVLSFVSLIALLNALLNWLGLIVGIADMSFEKVVGIIFVPLAWVMGVQSSEVVSVARLIGIKTVINEFVGYQQLGLLTKQGLLSVRSEAIATYAMCGFANPGSVAIFVSGLVTMCPEKRQVITQVAFRAFVAGSFSSFLSASLAGFITPESGFIGDLSSQHIANNSINNDTSCYLYSW